jgi:iron complex outermembrane receptor protein
MHRRGDGRVLGLATRLRRRSSLLATAALLAAPGSAWAQRSTDSAVARAEDAFGTSVGQETIGIYSETDVRGFNPQKAGNARIDEVYFDHFGLLAVRARSSYTVRVGMTAAGDASPAPSGIVAYQTRTAGDEFRATVGVNFVQYGGSFFEIDAEIPIVRDHLSVAVGGALARPHMVDGANFRNYPFALIPRLRFGTVEVKPFISGFVTWDSHTRPLITSTGPFLPPMLTNRRYLGQDWAAHRTATYNNGVVAHAELSPRLLFRGGFVQSRIDRRRYFTEIFAVRDPTGLAAHRLLADPRQDSYSNSWNLFVSYRLSDGDLRQTIHADVRDRHRHIESGGAQVFDFGDARLGVPDPEPKPAFAFGPVNLGSLDQRSYSLGYKAALRDLAQLSLGVTRSHYKARIRGPLGVSRSSADPWLYNASILVRPGRRLTLYAGYVSGLEDTGAAPENAANRNQQLPASRTSQMDAGLRWTVAGMRLVATVFEMKKPYYSFDGAGRYVELADLRHRGVELSAAGDLTENLQVVLGAVLMDPTVSGPAVDLGLVGPRPAGTPKAHVRLDATWRVEALGGVKITFGMLHDSRRAASAVGYAQLGGRQLYAPAHTTFDIGARHNFKVGDTPLSLRFVVNNVFNERAWKIIAPNTFQLDDVRRYNLHLIADF